MDYKELLEKYNLLFRENTRLRKENSQLKAQIQLMNSALSQNKDVAQDTEIKLRGVETIDMVCNSDVNNKSNTLSKISLFMSIFRGRDDVYAKRWENKNKGTSGYSPVCLNQWQKGVCGKPKISCSKCEHKLYASLNEDIIENHLRGNIVEGHWTC